MPLPPAGLSQASVSHTIGGENAMKKLALTLSISLLCAFAAQAQPTMVKRFNDWGVYSYKADGQTVCYLLTIPTAQTPANVDHGKNFFMVGPGASAKYEPQARMGYELKQGSRVKVRIGDQTFWMFTRENAAWMQHEEREPEMIRAMRGGSEMVIEATSSRGTDTSYTYSLDGITAALKQVTSCS